MTVSTVERPFALPRELITHVVDMPFPPGINQLWRSDRGRVHISAEYRDWMKSADGLALYTKAARGPQIKGSFEARIILDRNERGRTKDLDNYAFKAILDRAAAWGLIANDRHQERITAEWGVAQFGARLTLTELA